MNRTAHDCKLYIHNRLLILRNMFTQVSTDRFSELYDCLSEADRETLWEALKGNDPNELMKLIREYSKESLETMNMKTLRKIGQDYGIRGYAVLPKTSLLSAIYNRERLNAQHKNLGDTGNDVQSPIEGEIPPPETPTAKGTIPGSG